MKHYELCKAQRALILWTVDRGRRRIVDFVTEPGVDTCPQLLNNAERMVAKWVYTFKRVDAVLL